jgi:hypothetical protein
MSDSTLTPEQETLAQQLYDQLQQTFLAEARQLAHLLAATDDRHLLGDTEFEVRDRLHRLGAQALETAVNQRKKGGTRAPA